MISSQRHHITCPKHREAFIKDLVYGNFHKALQLTSRQAWVLWCA